MLSIRCLPPLSVEESAHVRDNWSIYDDGVLNLIVLESNVDERRAYPVPVMVPIMSVIIIVVKSFGFIQTDETCTKTLPKR